MWVIVSDGVLDVVLEMVLRWWLAVQVRVLMSVFGLGGCLGKCMGKCLWGSMIGGACENAYGCTWKEARGDAWVVCDRDDAREFVFLSGCISPSQTGRYKDSKCVLPAGSTI